MNSKINFYKNYQRHFNETLLRHSYDYSLLVPSLKNMHNSKINSFHQQNNSHLYSQIKPLKQTTYFTSGQSLPVKSTSMRNTFVNLGNSRYQINRTPEPQLNKSETFYLKNMDFLKNTHHVNNLAFPIINEKSKQQKNIASILPINQTSSKIINHIKKQNKTKKDRMGRSLQLNVQTKSFMSRSLQKKSSVDSFVAQMITPNVQTKKSSLKSIGQLSKSVDVQATNFLRQMIFAKQYQKKLYELQKNFVVKRRLGKLKQNKQKNLDTQKQSIDPWKNQHPNPNSPQDNQLIFY